MRPDFVGGGTARDACAIRFSGDGDGDLPKVSHSFFSPRKKVSGLKGLALPVFDAAFCEFISTADDMQT
jgi:hypothetical protein